MQRLTDPSFDEASAGGKAANLRRIVASSRGTLLVPDGFVVFHDEDLDAIADDSFREAIDSIGGFPVAVRSSGLLEDLADASFAGQYETFLSVADLASLRAKIAACRDSAKNERVAAYLADRNMDAGAARVSVLVQRMVEPRLAGVAFSIHPLSGREEHALVECCAGYGDRLVSGAVQPSRYVLGLFDGEIVEEELTPEGGALRDEERRALCVSLRRLQASFGCPQDVEWAVDAEGSLHILQSRPITRVSPRTDVEQLTNADFRDGGVSARACTPMMYSLYRNAMQHSMQRYFESIRLVRRGGPQVEWIAYHYGRAYWNAGAVKKAVEGLPGFHEARFDADLGIQKDYGDGGPLVVPTNLATVLPAIPVLLGLLRAYRDALALVGRFRVDFPAEYQAWRARIASFDATDDATFAHDLDVVLRTFHAETERAYFTVIYCNSNAQSDFKAFLETLDAATKGTTSIVALLGGLANVGHMAMQRGMLRLHRVADAHGLESHELSAALAAFLDGHGYHADAELDLTCPRWAEDPSRVLRLVGGMLRAGVTPADPEVTERAQIAAFEEELERVRARVRRRAWHRIRYSGSFEKHLERVRAFLSGREEMRVYSTQCYAVVRAYVVEAGRRLAARGLVERPEDVFMLQLDELADLASGKLATDDARTLVARRDEHFRAYASFSAPNEFGRGVRQAARRSGASGAGSSLVGLGCSAGLVEGPARIILDLDQVDQIEPGDILVTRFTDPGWTPVLGMVAGVVTEVGGLLSHAAVIGREYGIPAVLNLTDATEILRTGQRLRVDGSTGEVTVLEGAA